MRPFALFAVGLLLAPNAHAERLFRCEVLLLHADGQIVMPGWAMDEATGRTRATQAAWLLAATHRYPEMLAGRVVNAARIRKREQAHLERLDAADSWLVPGFVVHKGECTSSALPSDKGEAWAALWGEADKVTLRNNPAVAIESARRRQCLGRWQHRAVRGAEAAAQATSERYAAAHQTTSAGRSSLISCMTRDTYTLNLAGAPLPAPETTGLVQCARPRHIGGSWAVPPAYGEDLEVARENALQLDAFLAIRRAERNFDAAVERSPALPAPEIHRQALALGGLVVATDLAEQATLTCQTAKTLPVRPTWTPTDKLRCDSWPVGPGKTVEGLPADLEASRVKRCDAAFRSAITQEPWRTAISCDISCRTDVVLGGWQPTPVIRPGEVDRTSQAAAALSLSSALHGHDFHALGILTGGGLFEPVMASALRRDPDGFWRSIDQSVASGMWEKTTEWTRVNGHWLVSFK